MFQKLAFLRFFEIRNFQVISQLSTQKWRQPKKKRRIQVEFLLKFATTAPTFPKCFQKSQKMSLLGFQNFSQIRVNLRGRTAQLPLEHGESQAATKEQG